MFSVTLIDGRKFIHKIYFILSFVAEVRSLSETLLSAGARSFAAAIQSNTATERMGKGNYTFFVPLDEVKTPEFAEENIVVVDEDAVSMFLYFSNILSPTWG